MNRLNQFNETINLLNTVISKKLPAFCIAEHFKFVFEYCIEVELRQNNDLTLLRKLCQGLPAKELEIYKPEVIDSIYKSFAEMKQLLQEREKSDARS